MVRVVIVYLSCRGVRCRYDKELTQKKKGRQETLTKGKREIIVMGIKEKEADRLKLDNKIDSIEKEVDALTIEAEKRKPS